MTQYGLAPDIATAAPERVLLAVRVAGTDDYLFARWPDWPHPAMLSMSGPVESGPFDEAAAGLVWARMRLHSAGAPVVASDRLPVRMTHPRTGRHDVGWLRPVAIEVTLEADGGAPAGAEPDALLEAVERLALADAIAALPTDVERRALRLAAEALGQR